MAVVSIPQAVKSQLFLRDDTLGARVAQARRILSVERATDIGRPQLALLLRVSGESVRTWESGEKNPTEGNLEALAALCGVEVSVIRYGTVRAPQAAPETAAVPDEPEITFNPTHRPATDVEADRVEEQVHGTKQGKQKANGGRGRPS